MPWRRDTRAGVHPVRGLLAYRGAAAVDSPDRARSRRTGVYVCVLLLLLLAAGQSGCALGQRPEIEVAEVRWAEATGEAAVLEFDLDLRNLDGDRLELLEYRYQLTVDGQRCYTGLYAARASLGPGDERRMTIPTVIRYDEVGWRPGGSPPTFEYELAGQLWFTAPGHFNQILYDAGILRPRAGFRERGRVVGETPGETPDETPDEPIGERTGGLAADHERGMGGEGLEGVVGAEPISTPGDTTAD